MAMSATMGGLETLKEWLDTEIYQCNDRPVPLFQYHLANGRLFGPDSDFDIRSLASTLNQ